MLPDKGPTGPYHDILPKQQLTMWKTTLALTCNALAFLIWVTACNQNTSSQPAKAPDLPLTTASVEARTAVQRGLEYLDLGTNEKARQAFSEAIEKDSSFSMAYLFRANTANSSQEYVADIRAAEAHLEGASEAEKLMLAYEQTFIDNNWEQRLEISQKLVQTNPDIARFQYILGNTYQEGNQPEKARECYQKAIELSPHWTGGYLANMNSYIFIDPKDLKKAQDYGQRLVELAPQSASAHIALGDCFRAQNDLQKARDAYTKAVELDPANPATHNRKGHVNTFLGNMGDALQDFSEAAKLDSTNQFDALRFKTYTSLYAGDYQKGMERLIEMAGNPTAFGLGARQLANAKARCLDEASLVAFHLGQTAKMQELFTPLSAALRQEIEEADAPDYEVVIQADLLQKEALAAAQGGKFTIAKNKLEQSKTLLEPVKNPRKMQSYHFAHGYLSMQQKKYTEAITHLQQANQDQVYHRYWLAKAYELAGKKEEAMNLFRGIADFNFNSIGYALIRKEVKQKLTES